MALSPEERQRIYEEERARIEASQNIRSPHYGVKRKDYIIALVIVFSLIGLLVVARFSDNTRDSDTAGYMAEEFVKDKLKAPSTAEFCSRSQQTVDILSENKYRVSGWVDSQNSFGAKLRSDWSVVLEKLGKDQWHADSVDLIPH